jgi:hypothetical protein
VNIENAVVPLDSLLPDDSNPKRHSAENVTRLVSRIRAVGVLGLQLLHLLFGGASRGGEGVNGDSMRLHRRCSFRCHGPGLLPAAAGLFCG